MSKFTVIEYSDPSGDVDSIEVDLSFSTSDLSVLLSYLVKHREYQWENRFGPTTYFSVRYPKLMAIVVEAKYCFDHGLPTEGLTLIDWQE
jgi:hypothetical protein